MENNQSKSQCTGCASCVAICPKKCIKMDSDELCFKYPTVNSEECIKCGLCEEVCSIHFNGNKNIVQRQTYAAFSKDSIDRKNSSSGGVFSSLSKYIIENNGVVIGAAFNETYTKLHHLFVDNIKDLNKLRGSKYLQSDISDIYIKVKENLIANKMVLFSGTPCQIFALKKYLRKEYENLYLIEVACHGVPSQFIWEQYISYLEKRKKGKVKDVQFRYKNPSWQQYEVKIVFDNGKCYQKKWFDDLFMKGFVQNMYLRPSCYSCKHKIDNSYGDITLGDFWGIQEIIPEINDDKGVSLVVVQTKKGNYLLEQIKDTLNIREVPIDLAIKNNSSLVSSSVINPKSQGFILEIKEKSVYKTLKKYCDSSFLHKILKRTKRIIRKLYKRVNKNQ